MGLFSNYDEHERRLAEYKIELHNFKKYLGRYEELINNFEKQHGDKIKEYDDNLQRYQNTLEMYKDRYDNIMKDYDSSFKESTLTMITKQEEIVKSLNESQKKDKGLHAMLGFSLLFNLISISGITFMILYILELI